MRNVNIEEKAIKKLIVGLGNPGFRYENTKHNMGFLLLEAFAKKCNVEWKTSLRFVSQISLVQQDEKQIILQMPQTFMNLSGPVIQKCMAYYKIAKQDVLILCDDVALPFGELRLRFKGSSGGHNGVQSIIDAIESTEFCRLRLGVGRNAFMPLHADVLSMFTEWQLNALETFLERGCEAIQAYLTLPLNKAMEMIVLLNKNKEGKIR